MKRDEQRSVVRRRLVSAARVHLSTVGVVTASLIEDICEQVGLHPHAFRVIFPTDSEFLDAINDSLVEECASRLRGSVDQFVPRSDGQDALVEASIALANSWPLTRGGMLIRANRRVRGLTSNEDGVHIAEDERQFVGMLLDVFEDLMKRLGREFTWPPKLAVRVILDTYERSFETWLLGGNEESLFSESPYVQRTLPTLLGEMSSPATPTSRPSL